jgi:hypothetical protein
MGTGISLSLLPPGLTISNTIFNLSIQFGVHF